MIDLNTFESAKNVVKLYDKLTEFIVNQCMPPIENETGQDYLELIIAIHTAYRTLTGKLPEGTKNVLEHFSAILETELIRRHKTLQESNFDLSAIGEKN